MEKALNKVVKNTGTRSLFSIFASGRGSNITTTFKNPIILPEEHDYSIALCSLNTWYSWPNIDVHNNTFIFFDRIAWKTVHLPTGTYDLIDINNKIQELLPTQDTIVLYGDESTLKAVITIAPGYKVKFPETGGLSKLLGFVPKTLEHGTFQGDGIVEITSVNTILVQTDLVDCSYVRGKRESIIYSFTISNEPGTRINLEPKNLLYYPIAFKQITSFNVTLLDQDLKPLNLREEALSVYFDLKER